MRSSPDSAADGTSRRRSRRLAARSASRGPAGEGARCWPRILAAAPVWGWKDPRTCLTLPFWQDVIGSIRYVICIRNPARCSRLSAAATG